MRFNPRARLDPGQVSDGGSGGGGLGGGGMRIPIPGGTRAGGGLGGILIILLLFFLAQCAGLDLTGSGGTGGLPEGGGSGLQPSQLEGDRYANCKTGEDAQNDPDCARVLVVNSIQDFWESALPQQAGQQYQLAKTRTFTGAVGTGCGQASSQVGPFYCPADGTVYLDTGFFDEVLERELGGPDGGFVEAYVIGHEYGHHIQNLTGQMGRVRTQKGPESDAVRLELQADCYAGMWARSATETQDATGEPLILELTEDDVRQAIAAAEAVGDDRIQKRTQGRVNPEAWTHGSAEQRVHWLGIGYQQGDYTACDTFQADDLG